MKRGRSAGIANRNLLSAVSGAAYGGAGLGEQRSVSTDVFIFSVLLLINTLMALAMLLAARTLGQPRVTYVLAGAFGGNVLLYITDAIYIFAFRGSIAFNLLVSAIAMATPITAALAYRLRGRLPLLLGRFAASHALALLLILWFSIAEPNRGFRAAVVPIYASGVLLFGITAMWRPGRQMRLGERPIIFTSVAMAAVEFSGGLVLAAMGDTSSPGLEQAYKLIVFLGLPAMTVAAGIFSLYLLAGDLAEKLRAAADTDSLTGAPNRRAIDATGSRLMAEARATRRPLTIAICDVDHFKYINDLYGHGHGDEVLCRLTALFGQQVGPDLHGRFGGEEFVLFFPDCGVEAAHMRVEALRERIMTMRIGEEAALLTASFGMASMTLGDRILADILKRADRALYASKEGGRNRTTIDRTAAPVI